MSPYSLSWVTGKLLVSLSTRLIATTWARCEICNRFTVTSNNLLTASRTLVWLCQCYRSRLGRVSYGVQAGANEVIELKNLDTINKIHKMAEAGQSCKFCKSCQ